MAEGSEGAREGWLGAVGRPAEGWGTEVGRLWGGLRRRRAAWGGEGRPGPFKGVSTAYLQRQEAVIYSRAATHVRRF